MTIFAAIYGNIFGKIYSVFAGGEAFPSKGTLQFDDDADVQFSDDSIAGYR